MNSITITTDTEKLDIPFIHHFISNTYWAKDRTVAEVQTCINNSLNFGIYLNNKQIGYARVVTDYVAFAYLMDVFITEEHRNKGYSSQLMEFILKNEALEKVKVWRLATTDAHFLYEKFGFKPLKSPEKMMERITS
ncbi:MAG: GNAT family N-acetyltransferase [Bacteroidota bacterium]